MRLIDADALDKAMTVMAANDRDSARRTWARAICVVHDAPTINTAGAKELNEEEGT